MNTRVPVSDSALEEFIGKNVTKEMLHGRGYFFAKAGKVDDDHRPILKDFDWEESEDDEVTCAKVKRYLAKNAPYKTKGCWIKGIPAEPEDVDNREVYMVIHVATEEDNDGLVIKDITIKARIIEELYGGWGSIPGQSTMESHFFEMSLLPPEVIKELKSLVAGRFIPEGFTFVGKPMPENKDYFYCNPPYSMAKNSGWRNIYWHLSLEVDDDDIIESVEISTYERETSMFQRPHSMDDDVVDALDCVICVCDQYSDEEWKKVIAEG